MQFEHAIAEMEAEIARREDAIERARATIDEQISQKLKAGQEKIIAEEAKKARLIFETDIHEKDKQLGELHLLLKERDIKLAEAQRTQLELLRKQRELDDAKRELDFSVEKKVQESLTAIRDQTKKEAEGQMLFKLREKEEQLAFMRRQIEELKNRGERGSQQLQGEVLELRIESLLRDKFPQDIIERVTRGEAGGDILQRVKGPLGPPCGSILWELKRTKNWSDGWLAKLRDDQRATKADIALIVSNALPKGVERFDLIEDVWIAEISCAIPVAIALRQSLIDLSAARQGNEGRQTKMALVYQYLTGPPFRQRIEAIVEKFSDMKADLDKERMTIMRLWAKREAQIHCVIESRPLGCKGISKGSRGVPCRRSATLMPCRSTILRNWIQTTNLADPRRCGGFSKCLDRLRSSLLNGAVLHSIHAVRCNKLADRVETLGGLETFGFSGGGRVPGALFAGKN